MNVNFVWQLGNASVRSYSPQNMAFTSSISIPGIRKYDLTPRVCPTMKAKGSKQKKPARMDKTKTPTSAGAGFEKESSANNNGESKKPTEDLTQEDVSGASGDATPHRAMVPKISTGLEDPTKTASVTQDRPLAPIPQIAQQEIQDLRLSRKLSLDQLIETFEDARKSNTLDTLVVANRHLVTEDLLYRLTSAILQVENRTTDLETKDEELQNMSELRRQLIAFCWAKDYDRKLAVQMAEARLLPVLQSERISQDVEKYCGRSTLEVDGFWIVIYAAVAAWEERGKANPELVNVDIQSALKTVAEVCQNSTIFNEYLSQSLKFVQSILTSTDPSKQAEVVEQMDDDVIVDLGEFTEQIRLMPTAAYGGLVTRLSTILDYIVQSKYGISKEENVALRFTVPNIERCSRLVEFAKNSETFQRKN